MYFGDFVWWRKSFANACYQINPAFPVCLVPGEIWGRKMSIRVSPSVWPFDQFKW
jgi:hypothetical protein